MKKAKSCTARLIGCLNNYIERKLQITNEHLLFNGFDDNLASFSSDDGRVQDEQASYSDVSGYGYNHPKLLCYFLGIKSYPEHLDEIIADNLAKRKAHKPNFKD